MVEWLMLDGKHQVIWIIKLAACSWWVNIDMQQMSSHMLKQGMILSSLKITLLFHTVRSTKVTAALSLFWKLFSQKFVSARTWSAQLSDGLKPVSSWGITSAFSVQDESFKQFGTKKPQDCWASAERWSSPSWVVCLKQECRRRIGQATF